MITEILLVHHTHTDIGYTHPQPIVFELHHRFIEAALDLAETTADAPEEARFRWTCEVTGTTRAWWDQASNSDRDRFLSAVERKQFEVAALEWHLTPLADIRMLIRSLQNVAFFRELGIPVRSAMNTDVNGVPWGLVDVLLDHGIDGFSMSSNSHFGHPVTPRPGAFKWASPDGRELLVWNGYQYWHAANVLMKMPSSVDAVGAALPGVLEETERRGYCLSYLPVQITNPHHPDNAAPDATLSRFVEEWNARDPQVKIRTVLLTDVFNRLRQENLPAHSGDWTDYWNFGAGSSARETTVYLDGLRTLNAAHQARAWPGPAEPREKANLDAAHENLALYAEHTWGADCSINAPESIETKIQWSIKSSYAYTGLSFARLVLRDSLHRLALRAGGQTPTILLFNPLPFPVACNLNLPVDGLDWALTQGVHHRQRLDGALRNLPETAGRWRKVELPAMGYRAYPISALQPSSSAGLQADATSLASSRIRLEFRDGGGVNSLRLDGVEFAGGLDDLVFGAPVLERPAGGSRREIMELDFSKLEPAEGWKRDWARNLIPGKLIDSSHRVGEGAAEFDQIFHMENGDRVEVTYRLFSDEPFVDIEIDLESSGDSKPYSLAIPFNLPERPDATWHFDTAGAIVEFDREQLPDAARHFVTTQRFVRIQNADAALTISTPDLPLWKFGGMFFGPSSHLNARERRSTMLAWLANNYWEVNFLANQSGQTRYRLRVFPHVPEPVETSYVRAMPFAVPPLLHPYRELGASHEETASLLVFDGEAFSIESVFELEGDLVLIFQNLSEERHWVQLAPSVLRWRRAVRCTVDGAAGNEIPLDPQGSFRIELSARELTGIRLSPREK